MAGNSRQPMRRAARTSEAVLVRELAKAAGLTPAERVLIQQQAQRWVDAVRRYAEPSLLEAFLAEYGLSTKEGVALMCLAEALLRVPDTETIDDLIADKLTVSDWGSHSGNASSPLVNASTWALMLTGQVLSDDDDRGLAGALRDVLRRLGEPVVRLAVSQAMKELGQQFVLGETILQATERARSAAAKGYTHSFDMLGEGAMTDRDARNYHVAYAEAITAIARTAGSGPRNHPGISVKLSALHPRFEATQHDRSFATLLGRTRALAVLAAAGDIGFTIDAEEANRLEFTLDIVEALCEEQALDGWTGFGVVVQAYGRRALATIDWLADLAVRRNRAINVRLVKGAYWDTEIKRAQTLGLSSYPVFTRKAHTDVAYIACARRLLESPLYPQFATHNAHTLAAVTHLAGRQDEHRPFELQRLHGMGESLHEIVMQQCGVPCRIYAPVGVHSDLLAYLVRRLLENGASSSFVHQMVDQSVPASIVARDPFTDAEKTGYLPHRAIPEPRSIHPHRRDSAGWDLADPTDAARLLAMVETPRTLQPVADTPVATLARLIGAAQAFSATWSATPSRERCRCLRTAADLLEEHTDDILWLLTHEARRTVADSLTELREAVDFLRYYAAQQLAAGSSGRPLGLVVCISPWNFPLAILTGQVAAGLATGNCVIAKPAEQCPRIAQTLVQLLHQAGIPAPALQLACGPGEVVGAALVADPAVAGVCFTGAAATAQAIYRGMGNTGAPLIAETGGINTMLVDSTALAEQAVRDVITSAFQSAGQRCSALRMLYLQQDIADEFLTMLIGAMDQLDLGDPKRLSTDVGPVIDRAAFDAIRGYLATCTPRHRVPAPDGDLFIAPTLIPVDGIHAVATEVFGPVLHYATFRAEDFDKVIDAINKRGYGLTAAIHTRLDDRVQYVIDHLKVGNLYVNRSQIGATVESQPFGGEGLSGTGPKAGGPHYLSRLTTAAAPTGAADGQYLEHWPSGYHQGTLPARQLQMPSVTGEVNTLTLHPRSPAYCLGPGTELALCQALQALWAGCRVVCLGLEPEIAAALRAEHATIEFVDEPPSPDAVARLTELGVVAYDGPERTAYRAALAARDGPIVRLVTRHWDPLAYCIERHVCIDSTAAGGNTSLLLQAADE